MSARPRIATLLASATEIAYAIGLGDDVVAVSHECDYPSEVAGKPPGYLLARGHRAVRRRD